MSRKSLAHTRSIAVTGGKGGVGKTCIALNMALSLARSGSRVLILDGDLGLGNIDLLLNLSPVRHLWHVVQERYRLDEILLEGPYGLHILPAATGVATMAQLSWEQHRGLLSAVHDFAQSYDFLVIDTAAGISPQVISCALAAEKILVVLRNEPAALTDAYGLVKVLSRDYGRRRFDVLSNGVTGEQAGRALYGQFCEATDLYLDVSVGYLGTVPYDPALRRALIMRTPIHGYSEASPAAVAIEALGRRLRVPSQEKPALSEQLSAVAFGRGSV